MALAFKYLDGSDMTLERANGLRIVRKFRGQDQLPTSIGGDVFDYVASQAMAWVVANVPTYSTPMGTLHWNSLQLHENHYAQQYDISVTYGPNDRSVGAYQITVDQTGGGVNVTTGTVIGVFGPNAPALADAPATIGVDGDTVRGTEIPVEETKITVMVRHANGILVPSYIKGIGQLVGYPNSDAFLTYQPGEVLYLGGNFTETETEATAAYSFAISYNRQNFQVAGITIAQKFGWDLLDPVYKSVAAGGKPARQVDYFKTIRPAGREWKAYTNTFGWGA